MTTSRFEQELEVPNRLADVADPCTERYYPQWSSRGMRSVRCTRPAKATFIRDYPDVRRLCRIHGKVYARLWDDKVVWDA